MRPKTTLFALVLALIAVALPATAVAQSAGDEQYADPFGGTQKKQQRQPSSGTPSQSTQRTAQSNPGTEPTPPAAAPAANGSSKATGTNKQLPRTGLPAGLIAALGLLTLLTGIALRSALRPLVPSLLGRSPTTLGKDVLLTRRPPKR
jgi:hypothetical protein